VIEMARKGLKNYISILYKEIDLMVMVKRGRWWK
jgi:hypothetical protein